ncbi:MAG: 2-amino-4-hydroxy-6-hydroxymethyldihydropteridine diphosphokinase [Rhizobiaceae bacterium]|nr:2-amino-4-hydroxy-6-hydroxymethyldihydropteridine diphosphokinase [Rhizobiaceae bacterium]
MTKDFKRAWLGLGGNIGDVKRAMAQALQGLNAHPAVAVQLISAIYKTPPWGMEDQPWFLNCCAQIETSLSPEEILELCQDAERQGKRERNVRWGPRTIDIDIVAFEDCEQTEQRLTIPHPRATERAFVMVPLAEIAPQLIIAGKSASQWRSQLDEDGIVTESVDGGWWL